MPDDGTAVLLVSSDLFLGSRVRGAVELCGGTIDVAGSGALAVERLQTAGAYRLVLVDLETTGLQIAELIAARSGAEPPIVAYGPHVHQQRLDAARQAGCDEVLTRGQFDASLPQLLQRNLGSPPE